MKKLTVRTKKSSFYFFENEILFERSNIFSFASKRDTVFYVRKYRHLTSLYKEEKRLFGSILPSTLEKPEPERPYRTLTSRS